LMTATLLPSGQVLITGGFLSVNNPDGSGYDMLLASTELYDPTSNSFAAPAYTATMNFARFADTATLLPTGKVLIAGGVGIVTFMTSTELYDPTSNTFAAPADTATMNAARYDATATLLPSGEVLIAGGCCGGSGDIRLASTELYDPVTNSFAAAANAAAMNVSRENATATLLLSGQVLIAGGLGDNSVVLASTELYDPTTNTFAPAADTATMNEARYLATATLLPSGEVLITGGLGGDGSVLASTELYDPLTNSFAAPADTATMNVARRSALTVLLPGAATPTATPTPSGEITLLPPTVDFGTVTVGQASPASTVTLSNGTGKQIKIKGFATGGDYKVVSTTCSSTLNAGQSCNYMLSFRPQRAGTKNEAFRVTVTGTSLKVKLHGVGTRR
ncbi:MAG: kelch repeat-containing protein, partial [Candidatus Binataceae bacterium]